MPGLVPGGRYGRHDFTCGSSGRFVSTQFLIKRLRYRADRRQGRVCYELSGHHNSEECDEGRLGWAAGILVRQCLGAELGGEGGCEQQPGEDLGRTSKQVAFLLPHAESRDIQHRIVMFLLISRFRSTAVQNGTDF